MKTQLKAEILCSGKEKLLTQTCAIKLFSVGGMFGFFDRVQIEAGGKAEVSHSHNPVILMCQYL